MPVEIPVMARSSAQGLTIDAGDRESLSQLSLALQLGGEEFAALLDAALLDMLGEVVQLSGVSFSVYTSSSLAGQDLRQTLPAGVNVIVGDPAWGLAERDRFIFAEAAERGVERTVILTGDSVAVPAATVGTAFGVLESADVVTGVTRAGNRYLVGAKDKAGIAAVTVAGPEPDALVRSVAAGGLVMRRMEPHIRLHDIETLDELRIVEGLGYRVRAWLEGRDTRIQP